MILTIAIAIFLILGILSYLVSKCGNSQDQGQAMPVSGLLWGCIAFGFGAIALILFLIKIMMHL